MEKEFLHFNELENRVEELISRVEKLKEENRELRQNSGGFLESKKTDTVEAQTEINLNGESSGNGKHNLSNIDTGKLKAKINSALEQLESLKNSMKNDR